MPRFDPLPHLSCFRSKGDRSSKWHSRLKVLLHADCLKVTDIKPVIPWETQFSKAALWVAH